MRAGTSSGGQVPQQRPERGRGPGTRRPCSPVSRSRQLHSLPGASETGTACGLNLIGVCSRPRRPARRRATYGRAGRDLLVVDGAGVEGGQLRPGHLLRHQHRQRRADLRGHRDSGHPDRAGLLRGPARLRRALPPAGQPKHATPHDTEGRAGASPSTRRIHRCCGGKTSAARRSLRQGGDQIILKLQRHTTSAMNPLGRGVGTHYPVSAALRENA